MGLNLEIKFEGTTIDVLENATYLKDRPFKESNYSILSSMKLLSKIPRLCPTATLIDVLENAVSISCRRGWFRKSAHVVEDGFEKSEAPWYIGKSFHFTEACKEGL